MNFRPLHLPLSGVLIVLAVVMALPALADGLADSAEWRAFLFSSLITVFIAGLLYFSRADARGAFHAASLLSVHRALLGSNAVVVGPAVLFLQPGPEFYRLHIRGRVRVCPPPARR